MGLEIRRPRPLLPTACRRFRPLAGNGFGNYLVQKQDNPLLAEKVSVPLRGMGLEIALFRCLA